MVYKSVKELIGDTPLIEIDPKITGLKNIKLYAKCELYNPFGSIKDRTAKAMLESDLGSLKISQKKVLEASSGNTAKALQILCSMEDVKFKTITNRIKVQETAEILKLLGAEIQSLPGTSTCPDPSDPTNPISYIKRMIKEDPDKYYTTSQYDNLKNPETHYYTGKEIYDDLGEIDYFFGTLGTTGSSRGIITYFNELNYDYKKIGIIAEESDYIPGIRNKDEMHEVGNFNSSLYDEIVSVTSHKAIKGMLTLNRKVGILGGPTSGGAYTASLEYLRKIDETLTTKKSAVFIACDRVEHYISYIKTRRPELFSVNNNIDSIKQFEFKKIDKARELEPDILEEFITEKHPIIIDLRGSISYKNKHLKNSINILDITFENLLDSSIPFSKKDNVVLLCPTGDKSIRYSEYLNKKGYNTYSLNGGTTNYFALGYAYETELERNIYEL